MQVAAAAPDQFARDLARDRDDRHVGRGCLHERRQRVQSARARAEEDRRGPAARARVPVRRKTGVQLCPQADEAKVTPAEALPDPEGMDPGQAEHHLRPERLEALHDEVATDARAESLSHRGDPTAVRSSPSLEPW